MKIESKRVDMGFFQKPFFKDLGYYIHYAFSDTHTASHLSFLELLLQIYPSSSTLTVTKYLTNYVRYASIMNT